MEVSLFNDLLTLTVDLVAGRPPIFVISPKESVPDHSGTAQLTPDRDPHRKRPKDTSSLKSKKSRMDKKPFSKESAESVGFQGSGRANDFKLSTQDVTSPRNSFSATMDSKKGRTKKNLSVEGGRDKEKGRGRKTKSARQSATQTNEFFPNEIDKNPNGGFKERRKRLRSLS